MGQVAHELDVANCQGAEGNSDNRAWVKLAMLSHGVHPTEAFMEWFREQQGFVRRRAVYNSPNWVEGSTNNYPQEVRLTGDPRVTVAVNDYGSARWTLDWQGAPVAVDTVTGAQYAIEMIDDLASIRSEPDVAQVANLYGGSALSFFSPRTCYFFNAGTECRFCSLQGTANESDEYSNRIPPAELRHAIRTVAQADGDALTQIMIVGGNERNLDVGFRKQVELVHTASEELSEHGLTDQVSVHLIAMPPRDHALIDLLSGLPNVHAGFNLEVWDAERFTQIAPGKTKDYGREPLLAALDRLVQAVGPYRAHSILIAGLEPADSTLEGAYDLAGRGVSPIINAYHSDRTSALGLTIRPTFHHLATVAAGLQEIHDQFPVQPYWKGCGRNALDFEARQGLFRDEIPAELG